MGQQSENRIHMIVTHQTDRGEVTVLYREAIEFKLPRPCPVGVTSKARTNAVLTLLRKATLDLLAAVGAAHTVHEPTPEGDPNHETPPEDGDFHEA